MDAEPCDINGHSARLYRLGNGAELLHVPNFLAPAEAAALWVPCLNLPWERKRIRGMLTRRSNAWFADDRSVVYRYSGQVWPPQPLTTELRNLARALSVAAEEQLNCLLATQYPDGAATVGYHADDEPLFGTNPTIASLSLGAPRVFEIVDRSRAKAPRPDLSLELGDGALIIMRGTFQHGFFHGVKKTGAGIDPRINLSFRRFVGASAS